MDEQPLLSMEQFRHIVEGKNLLKPEMDALKRLLGLPHGNGTLVGNREMFKRRVQSALLKLSGNHTR